jgi:hypothetical protein
MLAPRRVLAKATLLLVALWFGSAHPAPAGAEDRFAGTWELVSFEIVSADGRATDSSLGRTPAGWIMYDGRGHMCVQIARADRPSFSSPEGLRGGPDEERLAYESYIAYCGAYVVHEAEGFIVDSHDTALSHAT